MSTFVWEVGRRGEEGTGIGFVKMTPEARQMVAQMLRQKNAEEIKNGLSLFSTKEDAEESERVIVASDIISFLEESRREALAARGITPDPDCGTSLPCSLQVIRACMKNFQPMVKEGERGVFGLNLVFLRREDFPRVESAILERSKKVIEILGVDVPDSHILFALCKNCKENMVKRGQGYEEYSRTMSVRRLKDILNGMAERRDTIASLAKAPRMRPDYNMKGRGNGNENVPVPDSSEDGLSQKTTGLSKGKKKQVGLKIV